MYLILVYNFSLILVSNHLLAKVYFYVLFPCYIRKCYKMRTNFITPPNLFLHFECWNSEVTSKRLKKGAWLIWHTTIWLI